MSKGDSRLRRGDFYRAAAHYEAAEIVDRGNPLAAIGAGLAYLGAGQAHRASYYLQRAHQVFPSMIQVRIDLDRLLGGEVADRRLAELHKRLKDSKLGATELPIVFLITYVYANRDQSELARRWAGNLLPLTGTDPILQMYARRLLAELGQTSQSSAE